MIAYFVIAWTHGVLVRHGTAKLGAMAVDLGVLIGFFLKDSRHQNMVQLRGVFLAIWFASPPIGGAAQRGGNILEPHLTQKAHEIVVDFPFGFELGGVEISHHHKIILPSSSMLLDHCFENAQLFESLLNGSLLPPGFEMQGNGDKGFPGFLYFKLANRKGTAAAFAETLIGSFGVGDPQILLEREKLKLGVVIHKTKPLVVGSAALGKSD